MRKDLDQHLKEHCPNRNYTCLYCGEKGRYFSITQVHDLTCEKKTLPCPNAGCGDTMERQQVPEHVSKCPHTVVSCKYKGIGCDAELERKDTNLFEGKKGVVRLRDTMRGGICRYIINIAHIR
jgi:hypothetical protein